MTVKGVMSMTAHQWPSLSAPSRRVFERTPLALALCQIRYAPILNVSIPAMVAPFQQAVIAQYPIVSQEQNVSFHVEGGLSQASVQSGVNTISWRFVDVEDTWTVVLTPEFVTIETRSYQDFSDFLSRLERVLKALVKYVRPTVIVRIGLRYVNEIRPGHADWASVVRQELLGVLGVAELAEHVTQSVQHVQLRGPDGVGVNLQHGSFPNGTVVAPRQGIEPPNDPFYLLDIDVFEEFKPGTLTVKPKPICDRVEVYHDILSRLFRWSVTEAYTATLGRRTDGSG